MTEHEPEVPARPAFVLRVRSDSSGTERGWVDDEPVTAPAGVSIHRALIQEARRRADRAAPGSTIRVVGVTADDAVFHLGIGPDGTAWEVPPPKDEPAAPAAPVNAFRPVETPKEAAPRPAYVPAAPVDGRAREPRGPLTDEIGRPIPTSTTTQLSGEPHLQPSTATAPPPVTEDEVRDEPVPAEVPDAPPSDNRGPSRRTLLLGGAGAVVVAGAATAGFLAFRGSNGTPRAMPSMTGTPLPDGLRPPGGLPASYLWSVVNLSDVAPRLAANDSQLICTVDNDTTGGTELVSLDATTGKSQWKADLPIDAIIANGPAFSPIDGTTSVVLVSQNQIMTYPRGGGEAKTWPVQSDWTTAITVSGVIVTKPEDDTGAYVLHGDRLARRAIVKGANPVAVLPDGTLVSTDTHGRVWLSADETQAPKPKRLAALGGTTAGRFVGATATQLITAFVPKTKTTSSRLRSFDLPGLKPRMTTAPIDPAVFPNTFMLAPDESWAVGRNSWIDMRTGHTHVITGRWSPIAISQYDSWSKSGDNILTADRRGKLLGRAKGSGGQVLVPRGGTAKVAYCVGSVGSDTTLYAVPLTAG
jgi:hypothetical protein